MATGILNISLSGLNAAMSGIRTVQHNIANVNTEGYHRQTVTFTASKAQFTGGGFMGTGVNSETVRRVYDQFLNSQTQNYQSKLASSEAFASYATQVDAMLGDNATGLNASMQNFFSSINEVANNPTSLTARQQMLSSGATLMARFDLLSKNLQSIKSNINADVAATASQINRYATQVQELNTEISRAIRSGQQPNDLLDQRDQMVYELNKLVNVNAIDQGDGTIALTLARGQSLVVGSSVRPVMAVTDPNDPGQTVLAIQSAASTAPEVINDNDLTGGRLGGLLAFRNQVLNPTERELGALAYGLVANVNSVHQSGFGLDGVGGRDFFTTPTLRDPIPSAYNTGNAVLDIGISDINKLASSDYSLTYDGANYTLTRQSDGTSYTNAALAGLSTAVQAGEGFSLTLSSGAMAAGDSFLIRPTQGAALGLGISSDIGSDPSRIAAAGEDPLNPGISLGVGDNSIALALAALQTGKLLTNGGNTLAGAYTQLVGRNASYANSADINVSMYTTLHKQSFDAMQSVSGVNLDEEAINLIQYQQAYQAAAKAIQTTSELFNSILSIVR
jgi:flagellar hook-associated protein 1 FlgK